MSGYPDRFTERARKVLDLSLREALSLGHNYVGTEHLLLGLVRERQGLATVVLADLGVTADDIRDATIRRLSGPKAAASRERSTDALIAALKSAIETYEKGRAA